MKNALQEGREHGQCPQGSRGATVHVLACSCSEDSEETGSPEGGQRKEGHLKRKRKNRVKAKKISVIDFPRSFFYMFMFFFLIRTKDVTNYMQTLFFLYSKHF